jgi:hypothetical protein
VFPDQVEFKQVTFGQLPSVSLRTSSGDSSSNSIRRPKTSPMMRVCEPRQSLDRSLTPRVTRLIRSSTGLKYVGARIRLTAARLYLRPVSLDAINADQ